MQSTHHTRTHTTILTSIRELVDAQVSRCLMIYNGTRPCASQLRAAVDAGLDITALHVMLGDDEPRREVIRSQTRHIGAPLVEYDGRSGFVNRYIAPAVRANLQADLRINTNFASASFALHRTLVAPFLADVAQHVAVGGGYDCIAHASSDADRVNLGLMQLTEDLPIASLDGEPAPMPDIMQFVPEALALDDIETAPRRDTDDGHCGSDDHEIMIELAFVAGLPFAVNGDPMHLGELITRLNAAGSVSGLDWLSGGEPFNAAAFHLIGAAHTALEAATLGQDELRGKRAIEQTWAGLVRAGAWHADLADAYRRFIDRLSEPVDGRVELRIVDGRISVARLTTSRSSDRRAGFGLAHAFEFVSQQSQNCRMSSAAGGRLSRSGGGRLRRNIPGRAAQGPETILARR